MPGEDPEPTEPRPVRRPIRLPGSRGWVAGAALLIAVAALAGVVALVLKGAPAPEETFPLPAVTEQGATSETRASPAVIVVSVVGRVREPGLVRIRDGARVADAIAAAGGARPGTDLTTVNLARKLVDGEQIHVGTPAAAGVAGAAEAGPPAKVNLNTATAEQLEELPGVGEVTAQRILDWRTRHGAFTSVEQLGEIEGIGERRLASLREQVTV